MDSMYAQPLVEMGVSRTELAIKGTPPPTTLRNGKTFSSAPPIARTRTSAADIISVPLRLNKRSGNTFKRSYRW